MQRFHFLFLHTVCFLLCASFKVNAQRKQFNISLGSSLSPTTNSSWLSPSGLYAFGFYPQGKGYAVGIFLAGIPEKTVVWTANRDDLPVSRNAILLLNTEGRLVLQSARGQETTDVAQGLSGPASYASMLDSGNFVLHNSSGGIVWQSFDHPTDTILTGQSLLNDQDLVSSVSETNHSTGRFFLIMQSDGNLVQYPREKIAVATAYWASNTVGWGADVTLSLDLDGRLYLHNSTGFNIMNLTAGIPTGRPMYFMRIDWDGIFRLYSHNLTQNSALSILSESSTDKCDPTGQCGLNSYCIVNPNQQPGCRCLPGFVYVDRENLYSGCKRNFTAESFINSHGTVIYNIQEVDNYVFEDVPYSVLQETKDGCEQACLEDSICEAALFSNSGQCRMQRLPLRFAKRDESSIVFVKVNVPVSSTGGRPHLPINEGKKYPPMDMIVIVSSLFIAVTLVIVAVLGIVIYKCHVWSYGRIPDDEFCEDIAPIIFSYREIEKLTDCFKEEIGRGSSGTVYKGTMANRQKFVAVKRLDNVLAEREREFLTEIKVIGRTHHRNLVRLLGYSFDGPNKVLVYEYMSNGSLADMLFTPGKQCNWIERMDIARDIARGILYLHDECETQIIHCDIKPQNILMDDSKCAKISDFGLAKLMKPDQTKTFTGIRGTRGYVAPEWHRKLPVTVKADVYSFGVVLLQIICRRRSMDQNLPENQVILEDWAYKCFDSGDLSQLIGDEEVELKQLERMMKIALWCIIDEPSFRPSMKKVLLMLEGTVDIPVPPNSTSYLTSI